MTIASHHFDTQYPSYCDPALDKSGRLFLPNIALFKLAEILSGIVDDATSLRAVSYDSVLEHDRALSKWLETLPEEMNLDEYRIARSLASRNVNERRLAIQSVVFRTIFHQIRFTLHRPYASASMGENAPRTIPSLEAAIRAADRVIAMVGQTHNDYLSNNHWGP